MEPQTKRFLDLFMLRKRVRGRGGEDTNGGTSVSGHSGTLSDLDHHRDSE